MATKAEIVAKIQADIAEINTPGGIKKTKVAEILGDITSLAAPSTSTGQSFEVGQIEGNTIFRKIIQCANGLDLPNVDFSIPNNATMISYSAIATEKACIRDLWVVIQGKELVAERFEEFEVSLAWDSFLFPSNLMADGELHLKLTFDDATSENIQIPIDIGHGPSVMGIAKDFSSFGDDFTVNIEILPTSNLRFYNSLGEEFTAFDYSETKMVNVSKLDTGNEEYFYLFGTDNAFYYLPIKGDVLNVSTSISPGVVIGVVPQAMENLVNVFVAIDYCIQE
jgi:hypothetical protein